MNALSGRISLPVHSENGVSQVKLQTLGCLGWRINHFHYHIGLTKLGDWQENKHVSAGPGLPTEMIKHRGCDKEIISEGEEY
jgi:hypothetical protein